MPDDDEDLLRRAEQALAEIDRNHGLDDENASVLAALRIRIYGAPRKTLDDVLKAAGDIKGKQSLENIEVPEKKGSLEDAFNKPEEKKEWPS